MWPICTRSAAIWTPSGGSVIDPADVPVRGIEWSPCFRIIPSRYPPRNLFARVADEADLEAVFAIESITNDRLRDERGEIRLVAPEDRSRIAGMAFVMAPFTHIAPAGTRFTDGTFGAFYAGRDLDTAIDETVYHRERFLAATEEAPMEVEMRVLRVRLSAEVYDVRSLGDRYPEIYDRGDYSASQHFGRAVREAAGSGIVYDSVRREGGECVAIYRPRAIVRCQQAQHLAYVWDGRRISSVYEKKVLR